MENQNDNCAQEWEDFERELKLMQDHCAARPSNGTDAEFVGWFRVLQDHGRRFADAEKKFVECCRRSNP
jgi:hypothetical protein